MNLASAVSGTENRVYELEIKKMSGSRGYQFKDSQRIGADNSKFYDTIESVRDCLMDYATSDAHYANAHRPKEILLTLDVSQLDAREILQGFLIPPYIFENPAPPYEFRIPARMI